MADINQNRSWIRGVGAYTPEKILTNDDLAKTMDTNDEWIRTRTGILQRHVAADGEKTSDLAIKAAKRALENAGLAGRDIDLVILATTTADHIFPATAVKVQKALGATGMAFDMAAVCSGFVFALGTADAYLKAGLARRALVIGAETMTRLLDWSDRRTAVLFGDGAGAFVLEATANGSSESGFLGHKLLTDGDGYDALYVNGGVSCGALGTIQMDGQTVFKRACRELSDISAHLLEELSISASHLDWVVPHQANKRILDMVLRRLSLPESKMIVTVDKHANTSAASVPLAFAHGVESGQIQRGQLILTNAFAAGWAWGANLFYF